MSFVPTLGYWPVRSLGQSIRLLLKYSGVQFNDKRYEVDFEGRDREALMKYWLADKYNLGLDFPNLPYYIDENVKLTQSVTIIRYLGRKHGLVATDENSIVRQELVEQQLIDARNSFDELAMFAPVFDEEKVLNENVVPQLELLDPFLGTNEWFAGSKLTYVDFLAYEVLDWFRLFSPESVNKYENLSNFLNRFENLPPITAYKNSLEFISWPLFGPIAKWGYNQGIYNKHNILIFICFKCCVIINY